MGSCLERPYHMTMRFLHLSDIHLGKKLGNYDLSLEHRHALKEALDLALKEKLDAIVVAGDIYDSAAPSSLSMEILDSFIADVEEKGIPLLMISGNHDSPEKLHYLSGLAARHHVYIVTDIKDSLAPITVNGVDFFLLPYVNYHVAKDEMGVDYGSLEEAVGDIVSQMDLASNHPHVLVAHQSVLPSSGILTGSGSETQPAMSGVELSIGGSDVLPGSVFAPFDYVALGHIHKAIPLSEKMRYPGALLKFDRQEAKYKKTFSIVDINEKGVFVKEAPFVPLHDVVRMEGHLDELLKREDHRNDYVYFTLFDTTYQDEPMARLKSRFPLAVSLEYKGIASSYSKGGDIDVASIDPKELFARFYEETTGSKMDETQGKTVSELLDETLGRNAQ